MYKEHLYAQNCLRMKWATWRDRQQASVSKSFSLLLVCHGTWCGMGPNGRSPDRHTAHDELTGRSGWVALSTEPRVLGSGSRSITKLAGSQTDWRDSSISNQAPVTDLSPLAILWAEHGWIPNKHVSQKTHVSFNRVQIECPETLMLFYFLNVFCNS